MDCGRTNGSVTYVSASCPTAILCINDYVAIGAMKAVISRGMRIPEDFAIAGFDDTQLLTAMNPELTTVSQHSEKLGSQAMTLLSEIDSEGER